ncbi:MAG: hypothetical protein CMI66_00595 [Pedosphaera sp.]|nr:hypothetical protein [Pedosphaera sp.]HAW00888.1 hypothetical protein [Verrucomicrobiales bacterium]HBP56795.1 hypothetical protein [Verrucomicrobiales bacterium]HCP37405.1 hypothetical protein [Verrucomicrobiales bacterium]HCZ04841.1 hypothetical protein [Verrucomicrobiales bacterium]
MKAGSSIKLQEPLEIASFQFERSEIPRISTRSIACIEVDLVSMGILSGNRSDASNGASLCSDWVPLMRVCFCESSTQRAF